MNRKAVLAGSLSLILSLPVVPGEPSPQDLVKSTNEQVQKILAQHEKIDPQTEAELFRIIDSVTDFAAISRKVITPFCQDLSKAQGDEFDRTFQRLLRVTSIKKLGRYRADRFEYLGEEVTGASAVVKTIAYYKEDQVHLNYKMELLAGKWLVVNYLVDDVDTVRNYKKQFVRLFAKNNYQAIIERLKKKISEYEREF